MIWALLGCGLRKPEPLPVVTPDGWTLVTGADDPYIQYRPANLVCEPRGYGPQFIGGEMGFDVDADFCLYITVAQPAKETIYEGEKLFMRLWHFELSADKPSTATVAVDFGGRPYFEKHFPIPGPSGLDAPVTEAPYEVPAGTPVHFHVRNHGSNSYSLIELSVGGPLPE